MQRSHWIGVTALCAVVYTFFAADTVRPERGAAGSETRAPSPAAPVVTVTAPPFVLPATGHYVLVIEGDRGALAITHASHKQAVWAGPQKGLRSDWQLSIRDGKGAELRRVPLDLSPFDLRPERQGGALKVQGCMVSDPRVGLLASAPCLEGAANYVLLRGDTVVGSASAQRVHELAGGGR